MLWRISKIFYSITNLITDTFLALFIWQQYNDLDLVLLYSLAFFLVLPIASLMSGVLAKQIDGRVAVLMGNWMRIIQLLIVIINKDALDIRTIIFIAIIGGLSEGFIYVAKQTIDNDIGVKDQSKYFAIETVFKELLMFAIPITAAYIVNSSYGYGTLFSLAIVIVVLNAIAVTFFKYPHTKSNYSLRSVFSFPGTNPDKHLLVKSSFVEGLSEGITLTILPIILLYLAGDILNWGLINSLLILFALMASILIRLVVNDKNSKFIYLVGASLFAIVSVFMLNDLTLMILVVFLVAKTLMDVVNDINYNSSLNQIIEEDHKEYNLHAEYEFLISVFNNLGRIIPVIILILISINIQDAIIIRLFLIFVGIIPLITLSFLGKSLIFDDSYKEMYKISNARKEEIPALNRPKQEVSESQVSESS